MLDNANTLRTSSSTTSTVRPSSAESRLRARSSICRCSGGSSASTWCRNSVTSSSSRSGERASLMMMDFEKRRRCCSSSRDSARPPLMSGRFRSMTTQSNVVSRSSANAAAAVAAGAISTSLRASSWRTLSRWRSSSSTTSTWRTCRVNFASRRCKAWTNSSRLTGFSA
ncbi:hypothetical protein G6F57_021310 [Rhizopus arrhizus]|nr:hypothetical protein G6F57_021310 [Rhizopus arrhizus]